MAGDGSIYQTKDGYWWAAREAPGSGRIRRRRIRRKRRTRAEARAALAELVDELRHGVIRSPLTVGAYLAEWVDSVRNVRDNTARGYRNAVELHLVPTIGHVRLSELEPIHVERMLAELAPSVSPKHLRNIHGVLRTALNRAVRHGLVRRNVAGREYVDAPRVPDREPEAYTIDEVAKLLDAATGDWTSPAIRVSIGTGVRQGELLGLAWEDVDLETGRLHVRRALVRRRGAYYRDELKTGSRSRRVLPIAEAVAGAFREQERQVREAGLVPIATGPVFVSRSGEPLNGSWLTHRFYAIAEAAGVRRLPYKNLRTTFSTRLFEAGVPDRTIADWMGHRRTSTTHGHYIGTADGSQDRALAAVGGLLG